MSKVENPIISIIMPVYNQELYVGDAIKSVQLQSFLNWELIVVNDGSTDSSPLILYNLANNDERIKVINQKNSGKPAIARNRGLKIAKGRYITFLDPDDYYLPDRLLKCFNIMQNNPNIDVLFHDLSLLNNNNTYKLFSYLENVNFLNDVKEYIQKQYDKIYIFNTLFYQFMSVYYAAMHTDTIFFKKNIHIDEGLNFNEKVTIAEDTDLWIRASRYNNIAYYDESLSVKRLHNNNITYKFEIYISDTIKIHEWNYYRYFLALDTKNKLKNLYQKKIAQKYNILAYHLLLNKRNKESRYAFIKAFLYSPNKVIVNNLIKTLLPWANIRYIFKKLKKYIMIKLYI